MQAFAACGGNYLVGISGGNHSTPTETVFTGNNDSSTMSFSLSRTIVDAYGTSTIRGNITHGGMDVCDWLEVELWIADAFYDEARLGDHEDSDYERGNDGETRPIEKSYLGPDQETTSCFPRSTSRRSSPPSP